jgi:RimJ/RimL family protein N-acetyltransferase
MSETLNHIGQAIGAPLPDWTSRSLPIRTVLQGRFCRLEPLEPARHAADIYAALQADTDQRNWTYLPTGPFATLADFRVWADSVATVDDPIFFAVIDRATAKAAGYLSLMRIDTKHGVIEVGHINYAPALQRRPVATDAQYLVMRYVFDTLGYRRYEWKCNALNAPSRAAATRLGFTYEGTFRQCMVVKGHNRDTAWFSIVDSEWPPLKRAFEQWLAPGNFDPSGKQRESLSALTKAALLAR